MWLYMITVSIWFVNSSPLSHCVSEPHSIGCASILNSSGALSTASVNSLAASLAKAVSTWNLLRTYRISYHLFLDTL